ncbi:MAG: TetR/AcrR family transcriptional regulator [Pseudomonadota bacterium]
MGRRSDHTRSELRALVIAEAHKHMAEVGFLRFSAREVAKRIGYSIGTIYNVFGTLDALLVAVNTRTFDLWIDHLSRHLDRASDDRIKAMVEGYFSFARENPNLWMAIYDHRLPHDMTMPEGDAVERGKLTRIVEHEIATALGQPENESTAALTRSLVAVVHGHCSFALTGTFDLLGETDPQARALARVRETLAAAARK